MYRHPGMLLGALLGMGAGATIRTPGLVHSGQGHDCHQSRRYYKNPSRLWIFLDRFRPESDRWKEGRKTTVFRARHDLDSKFRVCQKSPWAKIDTLVYLCGSIDFGRANRACHLQRRRRVSLGLRLRLRCVTEVVGGRGDRRRA